LARLPQSAMSHQRRLRFLVWSRKSQPHPSPPHSLTLANLTFDCLRPTLLADFWAAALGFETTPDSDDEGARVRHPDRRRPYYYFERVETPKSGKNRFHMDLRAEDMEAEVARRADLGATRLRLNDDEYGTWTVMADPEGNELCVMPGA
jgi:hypothetical protein